MALAYKPEIDGIRAIAVLAVILHHAGFGPAAGYVGVDIFFVISGYLITSLLVRELDETGGIDFTGFYARRARRILPAAILVILVVLAITAWLPPSLASGIPESAAASALFLANLHFQRLTEGYFAPDSAQAPLLHLWSLSVEEQFYVAWPLLLFLLRREGLRLSTCLAVVAFTSFCASEWLVRASPDAAFYQMPARAWELSLGGLVAVARWPALPRGTTGAALALMLGACFFQTTHFPGAGAIPAVLSTTILLAALHGGASNRVLASRPMVGVGLISYSLYLWHWPLLALDQLLRVSPAPVAARLILLGSAVLLAVATFRYVESPWRRSQRPAGVTIGAGLAATGVVAIGSMALAQTTVPPEPPRIAVQCQPHVRGQPARMQRASCLGPGPKVLIWGDSMAHSWTPMAQVVADRLHVPAATLVRDGCPALVDAHLVLRTPAETKRCEAWNRAALEYIRANGADTLIISARWQSYLGGGGEGGRALQTTLRAAGPYVRRILLVAPTPVMPAAPARCLALGIACEVSVGEYRREAGAAWQAIRDIRHPKVKVVNPSEWLCEETMCRSTRHGIALYRDTIHVSPEAAATYSLKFAAEWD